MQKLISVIVPIYNVEQYLDRCIKSIQNQTYQNLEIILVDDGSPDLCGEICERYAKEDRRIKVIHKQNGGLSDARNAGIQVATGEYIALVDSDDWIHIQMIEILANALEQRDAEIAICNFQYAYDKCMYKDEKFQIVETIHSAKAISRRDSQYDYFIRNDKRNAYIVAWNKLYHRRLFENIRYPKGRIHEDEYTTFKLLYEAQGITWIDAPLYYYYVRTDSIMGEFKSSRFDIFDGYLEKMRFYTEHKEGELICNTLFHAIHMLAQYQKWMEEAGVNLKAKVSFYRKRLIEAYCKSKDMFSLDMKQYMELVLFKINFAMYYWIWKKMKVR